MTEEKLETEIKVPKTPEEQLAQLIEATCLVFENTQQKSNPLVALWREGNLNFDFVMKEMELISQKKSNLSAGKRAAILSLVQTSVAQFDRLQAAKAVEQETATDKQEPEKESE